MTADVSSGGNKLVGHSTVSGKVRNWREKVSRIVTD